MLQDHSVVIDKAFVGTKARVSTSHRPIVRTSALFVPVANCCKEKSVVQTKQESSRSLLACFKRLLEPTSSLGSRPNFVTCSTLHQVAHNDLSDHRDDNTSYSRFTEDIQETEASEGEHSQAFTAGREFCIVNFYHLTDIDNPNTAVLAHRRWLQGREILGRIYLSHQGINAQLSGPVSDAHAYAEWVAQQEGFQVFYSCTKLRWPFMGCIDV